MSTKREAKGQQLLLWPTSCVLLLFGSMQSMYRDVSWLGLLDNILLLAGSRRKTHNTKNCIANATIIYWYHHPFNASLSRQLNRHCVSFFPVSPSSLTPSSLCFPQLLEKKRKKGHKENFIHVFMLGNATSHMSKGRHARSQFSY
jgi:hypothetical protein